MKESKVNLVRKIITIIFFAILIFLLIKLFPIFMNLTTQEGRIEFESKIKTLGFNGAILVIILEILKIVLIFLPGEPIELLTGMCYGPFWGLIILYIGIIISNILIISVVHKYGRSIVKDIVSDEKIDKIENMIMQNQNKSEIMLFILYFLPALPKDFITYVASLLPMSKNKIILISTIARFPAVFSSLLVGDRILYGDILSIIIIYAITYAISGVMAMIYKKISKEKREGKKQNVSN